MMKLRQRSEHQLSYYPANGSQYVRHRDAFPDDGSEKDQRRVCHCQSTDRVCITLFPAVMKPPDSISWLLQVTAIVYANTNYERAEGGKLRLWPPAADGHGGLANGHASAHAQGLPRGHSLPNGHVELKSALCPSDAPEAAGELRALNVAEMRL